MTNGEIYRKTLPFSLRKFLYSLLGVIVMVGLPVIGFVLTQNNENVCVIVTIVTFIIGIVLFCLLSRYLGYMLTAGQIAMMTKGITEDKLPDDVLAAGKEAVKKRFLTANVYFAISGAIRAITQQITRGINGVASALGSLGGDDGKSAAGIVGDVISAFVGIILEYVNYCCLGWVFKNGEQNAFKSTCDGAVIYFQNWKTMLKNAGKVFGLTLVSLLVIGGVFGAINYLILGAIPALGGLFSAMAEAFETDAQTCLLITCGFIALIFWGILHSTFVKPYLLVSVLRGYIASASASTPTIDIYGKLCKLSSRFKKTFEQADIPAEETPAATAM